MRVRSEEYFRYEQESAEHISFPLGGIGAGSIGMSGSGRFVDWEIFNRPSKGSVHGFTHFAINAIRDGTLVDCRLLHGPFLGSLAGDLQAGPFQSFGFGARREYLAGLPHFESCTFDGFYPVAEVRLSDKAFPGKVTLRALSPFIPMDSTSSSLPTAMFEISVENTTEEDIEYSVVGVLASRKGVPSKSSLRQKHGVTRIKFSPEDDVAVSPEWGELSIATDATNCSWQHSWYRGSWFDAVKVYWDDLNSPEPFVDRVYEHGGGFADINGTLQDHCTLAAHSSIEASSSKSFRFALCWYFPNFRKYWEPTGAPIPTDERGRQLNSCDGGGDTWRNFYAVEWSTVDEITDRVFQKWTYLTRSTATFRDSLRRSDLPLPVLDAVSANLSVLKSGTVCRLENGLLYGFEGCHTDGGCCEGSCSHVWGYQQALGYLFPDLERDMRKTDYQRNQDTETGGMKFRLSVPLGSETTSDQVCVDGQYAGVLKAYRDWKFCGDDRWLKSIWPYIRRALEFAWHKDNPDQWDTNKTGVLWGRQHHTLDMELFGPNSWLTGFFLAALKAAAEIASYLEEDELAREYLSMFEAGRAWMESNLFNGEYYTQRVDVTDKQILASFETGQAANYVLSGSITDVYWSDEHQQIKYQIGEGCMIDQTLAQWHANLYGLGPIFDLNNVRKALNAIFENNYFDNLGEVANPCRVFGIAGEAGTIICSWPSSDEAPAIPLPYAQETQHGYEYAFGSSLMQVGELQKGVEVYRAVRNRYRGFNRNPWNEIECGSNYARSMASYAALPSLSGFTFDMTRKHIGFAPVVQRDKSFRCFWSVDGAWGTVAFSPGRFQLTTEFGEFVLSSLQVCHEMRHPVELAINGMRRAIELDEDSSTLRFATTHLRAGMTVTVTCQDISVEERVQISQLDQLVD